MLMGFAKVDITPRVGVELCGFGPFINRHSIGIRDRLWSRAMAVRQGDQTVVVISNDIIAVDLQTTYRVRALVEERTGLPASCLMVHCTHTHSGPATGTLAGWGGAGPAIPRDTPPEAGSGGRSGAGQPPGSNAVSRPGAL